MLGGALLPNPQTTVAPVSGPVRQVCSQSISFDVTIDLVEILISFNREGFETTLVHVAIADHVVILLPTSDMYHR